MRPKLPRGTLFLNRNSGAKEDRTALIEAAGRSDLEVLEISHGVDCVSAVRERVRRGISLFIAAGGDGTVHHVVQAIAESPATLAVIPLGTYNHFARDLGIPLDWRDALEVALNGATREVDAARLNDRYFVNNVSLGLYPELVARREERGRDYPRWKARIYALFATLRKYPHVTLAVEADGQQEVIRTQVFLVSNNSYDLERVGIRAPRETLSEGRLSVYWLAHTSRWRMMRSIARYLAGRVREMPDFRSFRTTRMRVQSPRRTLKVGIDGEVFTIATPLVMAIRPASVGVKVPR